MRIGIRKKLIISFFSMLILPMFAVLVTGFNTQNTPAVLTVVQIILALLIPFCICALILGWIISSSILKPLQELNLATKKIKDGNFEFPFNYKNNDEMGDLCVAFDLMRKQLKMSLEKQAALEYSRKELIASISHDLRTPMSSIKGYVEGLQDGIIHDRGKFNRYITVIKNKTESLDNLIESLFQYSQLDINDQKEAFCVRDSKELLETVINPIEIEFADLPVQLEAIKPFPSVRIYANENGIAQVFDNLISNAKRYVDENGTITIQASVDGDYLKISVKDNGIGISQEDLPYVFDHFYRSEKSRSRHFGGTGLGLAICKKVIENHGGKIWAESMLDVGTTFYFTVPLAHNQK
ncbi:HAMP domain-containing sensor histidine kinase [Paenibacillus durus]|uniref:histidine kinase n=1 Tax=Paenibacillus durus ATCC 35681 TaxID=1333534 RepID=A0A0F7FA48_PAEDU|nr:HAMP domain-containing sensor histidine kinase [Paenibacillus durus]AKG35018.1 histidine kinase [Paenibacillus durus ATCC 35681]